MIKIFIDPDSEKFGTCFYNTETREIIEACSFSFVDLIREINDYRFIYNDIAVFCEDVISLKGNFKFAKTCGIAFKMGLAVGMCQQSARLLFEFLTAQGVDVNLVKVIKKHGEKIKHDELVEELRERQIIYKNTRENQDVRDAIQLLLKYGEC